MTKKDAVGKKLADLQGTRDGSKDKIRTLIEKPFKIDTKDCAGQVWKGNFVSKIPTLQQQLDMEVLAATLLNSLPNVTVAGVGLARMMATCEVCLSEKPKWWNMDELHDSRLLAKIYREVTRHHDAYFRGVEDGGGDQETGEVDSPTS